jgi:excisionase family DNA binding protein
LRPSQAAELLGVNADKIRAWIASGELKATNVALRRSSHPRWRIAEADLEDFKLARSAQPARQPVRRPKRVLLDIPDY